MSRAERRREQFGREITPRPATKTMTVKGQERVYNVPHPLAPRSKYMPHIGAKQRAKGAAA